MKNFKEYLSESQKTYNYRIKLVGDLQPGFVKALEEKLKQFEPVKIGTVKTTPVQSKPADFPAFENDRVSHFDCEFRYPAIDAQIRQLAQLLGFDPNRVLMQTVSYADSIADENVRVADENKDLLTDTDYPAADQEQKALSKDYATGPYDHEVVKNAYKTNFTVAGGKTPAATTTNDLPMGQKSPMSTVKRPAKPATGRNPRG
jgi:hypothetical protein